MKASRGCKQTSFPAVWNRYFHDEPKTWERFALAVFGEPAGFLDAVTILEAYRYPEKAVPAHQALAARERSHQAALATTGEVLPEGRPKKLGKLPSLSQSHRAEENGISLRTQKKLDKVARTRPDLHNLVKERRLTIHRASVVAGFVFTLLALVFTITKDIEIKQATEEERSWTAQNSLALGEWGSWSARSCGRSGVGVATHTSKRYR